MKEKQRQVDVKLEDGTVKKVLVKKPSNKLLSDAQLLGAKVWTNCTRDGIMTKKELEVFMRNRNIWDSEKDQQQQALVDSISNLERELALGTDGKLTKKRGKEIAISMRRLRLMLRNLISERLSLEQNTAEALSENAKFDFLVANCVYLEDGNTKVYNSLEDYSAKADDEVAYASANALAQMMYSIDKEFEEKLPENKFLKKFNFVNSDLSLVDAENNLVDIDGKRIDNEGYYLNEEGNRVDLEGHVLDADGALALQAEYVDDESEEVSIEVKEKVKKKSSKKKEADS
jgi:hypothetical protein